jgi:hypothetical protein
MVKETKKRDSKRLAAFQPKPFTLDEWRKTAQMLDTDFELLEVQFRQGIKSEYACMRCRDLATNKEFGLNCGGVAVVKKIREGLSRTTLPLILQIFDTGEYYDIK